MTLSYTLSSQPEARESTLYSGDGMRLLNFSCIRRCRGRFLLFLERERERERGGGGGGVGGELERGREEVTGNFNNFVKYVADIFITGLM